MSNRFVETATFGLLATLSQAFALVPTGLFVLATTTAILYQNEARPGLAETARDAAVAAPDRTGTHEGRMVSVTAPLRGSAPVGDPVFFESGPYAGVVRQVEMYAWRESVTTETRRKWGGGREVDTITEYTLGWTNTPAPPSWMRYPDGHENPPLPYASARFVPESLEVGAWRIDPTTALVLDGLPIGPGDVQWTETGRRLAAAEDGWFYLDGATGAAPELGDVRIRFVVTPTGGRVTAFGDASGATLRPHAWLDGVVVSAIIPGDRAAAIRTLEALDSVLTWVVRAGGTVAVVVGLALVASPLFAVLDIVPPFGVAARVVLLVAAVPVAIAWSALVIGLSQILHSPGFLIIAAILASGVALAWWDGRRRDPVSRGRGDRARTS